MAIIASTIMTGAAVLMNDPSKLVNTDARLLPILRRAYRELQRKMIKLGVSTVHEITSTPIEVPANTTQLIEGALLPADLLYPITLWERADGQTAMTDFLEMEEVEWEPLEVPSEMLRKWVWREDAIKFLGATTAREVLIRYAKDLATISNEASTVPMIDAQNWLEARTAAIACLVLHSNKTRAQEIQTNFVIPAENDLLGTLVNRRQSRPVRRQRTKYRA